MRFTHRAAVVCGATAGLVLAACRPAPPSGREALATAVSTTLPFSARLSGGFAPSTRGVMRAGEAPALPPDARIAIAELEKRAIASPTPEALADLGVAYLVQGDIDRATTTLEDAALQQSSPAPWSDLSAAYLVKASQQPDRRVEALARALEAAERSLKVARTNEALFNRALARDGLAPYTGSPAGWNEYLALEADAAWRTAAQREAGNDKPVVDPLAGWEKRLLELRPKLAALDAAFVTETVRLYPEASIDLFDRELLLRPETRPQARLMAAAIHEVTGDKLASDEVAAAAAGGAALARAHAAYAKGRAQFDGNALADSRQSFEDALQGFSQTAAPYRLWAATYLGTLDWFDREFDRSQRNLVGAEREARARGYRTLLARVIWQRGLVHQRQWRVTEALAAFRESASLFAAANQREYAVGAYHNLADVLRTLGEVSESWTYVGRTLEALPLVRSPGRRYLFLLNASLFASRQDLHEAALLFQNAAVAEAPRSRAGVLTEATLRRASIHLRRADETSAQSDFNAAAQQVAALPDGPFKPYASAELDIVRAQMNGVGDAAVTGLQRAITFFERTEPARVPGLYLLLARTPQARASQVLADNALQSGIATLERQQAGVGDEALRISYFDDSWSLFQDMVTLQVAANHPSRAFEFAERSRARSLLASAQGSALARARSLDEVKASLPASVLLVHYATLPDRVLIWTVTRGQAALAERRIGERELARLVNQHRAAIQNELDNPGINNRLHEILVAPFASAASTAELVVLVPDGYLQQLPFATLRDPATRRFLIEDHALLLTPSASFFVDAADTVAGRQQTFESALLVGNPTASGTRPLPGAEAEVAAAAPLYPQHRVLTGRDATRDRFLELAPSYDVVHFGGHALVNPEFPLLSRLMFADQGGREQPLFAHEISRVRFTRTRLVFLAACSTASGTVSRGEGVLGVARPFLAGGVPSVIASQWDVDDRATEQLTLGFHRELKKLRDPVRAMRAAQLAMLRSGDPAQAPPRSWGAFVTVGTATRESSGQ